MAWHPLANSLTADASDVNDNFSFVAAGTRAPRSSAGVSFAATTGVYNIGTTTARFNTLYANNLDLDGSVTTADASLWVLLSDTILTDSASSVDITGLNGDVEIDYKLNLYVVGGVSGPNPPVRISLAGVSGSSYSHQYVYGNGGSAVASRSASASAYWSVTAATGVTPGSIIAMFEGIIHAKTGNERTIVGSFINGAKGTYVNWAGSVAGILNDTSSTITSIKISGSKLGTGTHLLVWGRK